MFTQSRTTVPIAIESAMPALNLSFAFGNYDRTRPLMDGDVQIDGVEPVYMTLEPEEIFHRAFRHSEFDVCELSLSSFSMLTDAGGGDYVGIPVFLSRTFRHASIYIRTDRDINSPSDLKGRRVGLPEWQLTACVWSRALLKDDFGVQLSDLNWIRGGIETPGRSEKVKFNMPSGIEIESAPDDRSLSQMLAAGEIDAMISPRPPSCFERREPHIGWLFEDPIAAATDYFRRTRIFPIMHMLGIRRSLCIQHPWLPFAVLKAFSKAKQLAVSRLADNAATKVTMPWAEEQVDRIRNLMGHDYWSYGLDANRLVLENFLKHHHEQGLSSRLLEPAELFHPSTLDALKI